jgi:hypothetical protein
MDRYLLELDADTKARLDRLRAHPGEPYGEVINRLIDSFEDDASLTRDEVEEIRQALRDLKEGRFVARGVAREEPAPAVGDWFVSPVNAEPGPVPGKPGSPVGDPQAVKDMEALFSGTANPARDDPDIARYRSIDDDSVDIHEIDPFDRRGRARTHHLDSL